MRKSLFTIALATLFVLKTNGQSSGEWPRPVPARIHDGSNTDLFVMTLGDVQTSIADGTFDPAKDQVTLKDGTTKDHYYRDTLGIKYYQPLDKSHFPLPPSGWCTWYYYYSRITADEVKLNTDWIAANLKDYGAQYVQIDDGWQGDTARNTGNRDWTTVNPQHFPDGMADLATYIKSRGLTPGLWLAPHGQSNPSVISNNPNVFLLRTNGTSASDTWEGRYLVDPSTPETQAYLHDLFTKLVGWGFEYFKIDGQPAVVDEYKLRKQFMKNPSDDNAALYRKTIDSIRGAIGKDRYLLGCWGIPTEGVGVMDGSRTGGDIVLGWGGFQVALRPTMQYYYLHNIAWYCDPDVLCVRSPLTMDQARVWATLAGLTGQAVMSSDRLPDLSEDRVELLRRVYPATDIRPLDLFPNERDKRIWDLKINHLGRNYDVVGVFNFDTDKSTQTLLKWQDLGLPADKPVHVFDFWNKEYLGAWSEGYVVPAAPTSVRVLTLVPETGHIQLVSTSRHITQGWIDLAALTESESNDAIKGASKVVKNDPYELRFAFPQGTNYLAKNVTAHTANGELPVKIFNHQGWATVQFTAPENTTVDWQVQFAPTDYYHYPPSDPTDLKIERAGLDGVDLNWAEQYYLNAGYQVFLDGKLLGYTPEAKFPVRGLDAATNYTVTVKTVAEDGRLSPRQARATISLAKMIPATLPLTQLEPILSKGRWRGFEADERMTPGDLTLGGKHFDHGISAFAESEIQFDLKGLYNKFTATAGLDASSADTTNITFTITGDGKELWKNLITKTDPKSITLDITAIHNLVLKTTVIKNATAPTEEGSTRRNNRTQIDWADPTVTR